LQFTGAAGQNYRVNASSNLVTWKELGVALQVGSGLFQFADTNATAHPVRFYRVVSP
jgi:hypothetical protein